MMGFAVEIADIPAVKVQIDSLLVETMQREHLRSPPFIIHPLSLPTSEQETSSLERKGLLLIAMLFSLRAVLVTTFVAFVAIAAAAPVNHGKAEASSSADHIYSIVDTDLDLDRPSSPSLQDLISQTTHGESGDNLSPLSPIHEAASSYTPVPSSWSHFHSILIPLPTVRTDIAHSFLAHRFGITSNVPLHHIFTPAERAALFSMTEQHLHQPATWLHAIVDEPQFDLRYRRQLYVASPLVGLDWRGAVNLPVSEKNAHWLPVAFYKADVDHSKPNSFKVAGIEIVKDPEEASRLLHVWDSVDTLAAIGKRLGMTVGPAAIHL